MHPFSVRCRILNDLGSAGSDNLGTELVILGVGQSANVLSTESVLPSPPINHLRGYYMAGSVKWFLYTAEDDTVFALSGDESNIEAVNGTEVDYTTTSTAIYAIPSNLEPRYAYYGTADGTRTLRIPVLSSTIYEGVAANTPTILDPIAGSGNLSLLRLTPERITRLPKAIDTGLLDGDAT